MDGDRADSFVRSASTAQVEVFVASCVERSAAAMFAVLSQQPGRDGDADAYLALLEGLWQAPSVRADQRQEGLDRIGAFAELQADEEPPGVLAFVFDAAVAMECAYLFLVSGDRDEAVSCSNQVRNSAFFLDNANGAPGVHYDQEMAAIEQDIAAVTSVADPWQGAETIRTRSRVIGQGRMESLLKALA